MDNVTLTSVTLTSVTLTSVTLTNVTVTVGICSRIGEARVGKKIFDDTEKHVDVETIRLGLTGQKTLISRHYQESS